MRRSHRKSGSSAYTPRAPIPDKMYFKMGEVTKLVGVQAHVLRYWEKEIPAIRPGHSSANQRRYRRRDVELFREVRRLLYEEKFTLAGARKHLTGPAAPQMPPDPDTFVHDFDADPALNDLTATIAEHDMYSPDLLQEMQETITKTLSDLTTSIQEHDTSGSDLLQELHDAITKTSSARPVIPPFARGPVPTAADAIEAHRVSQGAAAYIERAASRAAVMAHSGTQAAISAAAPKSAVDPQAVAVTDQGETAQADAEAQDTALAAGPDASGESTDAPTPLADAATPSMEAMHESAAAESHTAPEAAAAAAAAAAEEEEEEEEVLDVDTDTGLPAAYTWEGADAADDLLASNECEDVLATSSYNDGVDPDREIHAWNTGGDPEDVQPDTAESHHDADMACDEAQGSPHDPDAIGAQGDATHLQSDATDTFRAWDHPLDPDAEAARLADEAEQGHESTYVLYRTDEDSAGPDISYGTADATMAPDIAYASGDMHTGPEIAYVSGETSVTPDVSYGVESQPDPFDVAHASGEADAAFNVFQAQADDTQSIELPCMTPQSIPVLDVAYASGLYGTPEVASDSLHTPGSGLSGFSGLPMAALHFASQGQSEDDSEQASVGAWGAPVEPGHGMYNAAALASALPAACYGAEDADIDEVDEAELSDTVGLQAVATMTDLDTGASVYHAWHAEMPLDDAQNDAEMSDATDTQTDEAQEALDDLPDSPYAAFLSADPVTCAWPDTSGSAFDFTPEASEAEASIPTEAEPETSEDPAVLAAWDAMAAIGVEDTRDVQAAESTPTLTREATGAAEASLEASRLQLRDAEVTPTPVAPTGRIGAAASFEEGEEPSGGFYAYVEVPAEGLEATEAANAHANTQNAFYTPVEPTHDTRAPGPADDAAAVEPGAPKPLTIPTLDAPMPRAEAYSEAGQTQVVGEALGTPAAEPWATPASASHAEDDAIAGAPVAEASNSSAARPAAARAQHDEPQRAPAQAMDEQPQQSSVPATPISPATPVMSEAPRVSQLSMDPAESAIPEMSEPMPPASLIEADAAPQAAPITPVEPGMSPAKPMSAMDAVPAIVSPAPFDIAHVPAPVPSGEPMPPMAVATASEPMAPATAAATIDPPSFSASMVPAEPMASIASATPFDPMPLSAPMVPTEGLHAMAGAMPVDAMPLPAPMPPAVPTASLAAMTPVELMAAIASLRPSKPAGQQAPTDSAEPSEVASTPDAPVQAASADVPQAGVPAPAPPVAPPTATAPLASAVPPAPVLVVPASAAAATGAAVPRVIVSASRAVNALRGRAFTEVLKSLAGDYDGPHAAAAATMATLSEKAEAAPATATNSVADSQAADARAAAEAEQTARRGDPEDMGTDSDNAFADASYGMDLSPDDLANAHAGTGDVLSDHAEQKTSIASDTLDGAVASDDAELSGVALAETAGALGMASEALAESSTAMAVAAEAVATASLAAPKPPHDHEERVDQATEVPVTPPPFEHPPYFETPAHDTLAVQLLRQKLRSGLQDILRIATD